MHVVLFVRHELREIEWSSGVSCGPYDSLNRSHALRFTAVADSFLRNPEYTRWTHVFLRVIAGAIIIQHGSQKLFGLLGGQDGAGHAAAVGTLLWVGGLIEFFGGAMLLLGLWTRAAAFLLAGMMAVAYFTVHARRGFWPILNHGELAVALAFIFLYLAAAGAGPFSLDGLLERRPRTAGTRP